MRNPKPRAHYQQMESQDAITGPILSAAFEVSNTLGAGFLEKVYQRALLRELKLNGIKAAIEVSFPVIYKGQLVSRLSETYSVTWAPL
jgi:GxxExxY protein